MTKYSLIFFGSSKYAIQVLEALRNDGRYDIKLVVTTKDPDLVQAIKNVPPTVGVVVDYGLLIPADVIRLFPAGVINLHPSLLPKHRGAIPAVSAILEGDKVTGVTIIKINEKFDAGEIIAQEEESVLEDDTPPVLYERLFRKGITLLLRVLPEYLAGHVTPKPQQGEGGPYERRLTKAEGRIDWRQSDEYLERFVRAMTPWPGAWTTLDNVLARFIARQSDRNCVINAASTYRIVKILKAHLNPQGHLEIDRLQLEGKKPMGWKEFTNGYLSSQT